MHLIGELAGLATSFFFALTYLVILNFILFGEPLPISAESSHWIWLGLSGVIGLSLGDAFYFQSLISIEPRLGSLLLNLAPIFGSIIAWIFLGEVLTPLQITGIVGALSGIGWVAMSHEEPPNTPYGHTRRGVFFGILAGLGQATGLVLSKQGMFGEFSPFQANAIRMFTALLFTWTLTIIQGKAGATVGILREKPKAILLLTLGALVDPVLGVSSSLVAVQHTEVGTANTFMA